MFIKSQNADWSFYITIFLSILLILFSSSLISDPVHIYGIHSWGWGANGIFNGKDGWTVEVINTDYWPYDLTTTDAQNILNEHFTLIIRINKFFGQTIPANPADFDAFATACANKVNQFKDYCNIWIIGNEMNADFEGGIYVYNYRDCYKKCRTAIKGVQPDAIVLTAAVAPWNSTRTGVGPYPSNRQWLNYMYQLVNDLDDECDGYAIHAYGGRSGDTDPRNDDEMGFGVYKKWMEIITGNSFAKNKPVFLTEMNHAADGQGSTPGYPKYPYPDGYIQKLFEEINNWNEANTTKIHCAAWFSYANGGFPGYNISTNSPMSEDFKYTTQNTDYRYIEASISDKLWEVYK